MRLKNHPASEKSKAGTDKAAEASHVWPGALVFIKRDLSKLRVRECYIVVKQDESPEYCWVKKFEHQCRGKNCKV